MDQGEGGAGSDREALRRVGPPGADGHLEGARGLDREALVAWMARRGAIDDAERARRARASAILAHMSVFFGFPFFLFVWGADHAPLVRQHARASARIFAAFYLLFFFGILVWWPAALIAIAIYGAALGAIGRAASGRASGAWGLGGGARFARALEAQRRGERASIGEGGADRSDSRRALPRSADPPRS